MFLNYIYNLSPVDQFLIFPIGDYEYKIISDLLSLNLSLYTVLLQIIYTIFFMTIYIPDNNSKPSGELYALPTPIQASVEIIFIGIINLINDNIRSEHKDKFYPFISYIFFLILFLNLFGLIPYNYTVTSQLFITFTVSGILFIGINIICFRIHKLYIFSLFLPTGTSFILSFLLVPIEFISYIFRPISLSIRLFANMMAGHTLLKVIAGFAWALMSLNGIIFTLLHFIPFFILIPLFFLETAVAVIQSFVFTVLICIYINDALNLH
jgi:F-type H+-transporting ATPase subunit a